MNNLINQPDEELVHICCCKCDDCATGNHCYRYSTNENDVVTGFCGAECDCGDIDCSFRHDNKDLDCFQLIEKTEDES